MSSASVTVDSRISGEIGAGLLVFVCVMQGDTEAEGIWLARKVVNLRIFEDEGGQMNRSVLEVGGALLVVSQFTLHGDCRKGRRPSWHDAAPPESARQLYEAFLTACRQRALPVEAGVFQAMMDVRLTNAGPVTMLLDSHKTF